VAVRASKQEKDAIRAYVEGQAHEEIVHLEKAASELVGPVRHEIWDVHCPGSRWWVVTNPTNLYSQQDFKSRDVVLTFHIGLALRQEYAQEREVPVSRGSAELLAGSWRRWQQAFEAYESGDEAETFQAVGMRWCPKARSSRSVPTSGPGRSCWRILWQPGSRRPSCARI
jgi:hypothetical protein